MNDKISENNLTKSERTRKRIQQTYLSMMGRQKWDRISVKELCAASDITRGTFYQYYDDIYDLMEQIQSSLLSQLKQIYCGISSGVHSIFPPELFDEKFDCSPPRYLNAWFLFCKNNRLAMVSLLDPVNGDSYFVGKLKNALLDYVNLMMDEDGMPHDSLREHFVRIFMELHFLSARTWLSSSDDDFLSEDEIINLLNTMRVGANYLSYRRMKDSSSHPGTTVSK